MKTKELESIEVLLRAGYKVTLYKPIDKLHSITSIYTPKDLTDGELKDRARLGRPPEVEESVKRMDEARKRDNEYIGEG